MGGGARERKQTEKGKAYAEAVSSKKTVRRAPTDWKGLISSFGKSTTVGPTERSAMGMEIEVPRASSSAPKAFEMKAATFRPPDAEMDTLTAQLSKSGIGGRKRKTRRRRSRKHRR